MTKVFLAAGVAAIALVAPASAAPGDRGNDRAERVERSGGGQRAARVERQSQRAERPQRQVAQRAERPQRVERQAQRAERPQRVERQAQRAERPQRVERQAQRAERPQRVERQVQRVERPQRVEQRQAQRVERAQVQQRMADRRDVRQQRIDNVAGRDVANRNLRVDQRLDRREARLDQRQDRLRSVAFTERQNAFRNSVMTYPVASRGRSNGLIDGCPPGLWKKGNGCLPPGQAAKFIGSPLSTVSSIATLSALPASVSYLYPDTDDYYYRYGDGYLYQVDRGDNLISALLPLIAGGFMPGQYLPTSYMNSYVPNYYGFNSFYQDSPYDCNRYVDGVVYQIDCASGLIEGVVPLYASGYGVGQMLPTAYSTYNVPYQYRDMYYNNADYGYYYGPGAIYQYDQGSNLITSVAALLSPGMTIGQPLPAGYGAYNVPLGYRDTYYDTPNSWYRYNNGQIYQIDPVTQLVTAIVASALT